MPVVLRTRRSSVAVILIIAAAAVPLVGDDDTGPPPPWWVIPIVTLAILLAVARTKVEIGPVRVRIVGLGRPVEIARAGIVAIHASGGRNRPPFVAVDDGTTVGVPVLLSSHRLAAALGVPHLSWSGDREVAHRPFNRWFVVLSVLAVVALGTVVFLRQR